MIMHPQYGGTANCTNPDVVGGRFSLLPGLQARSPVVVSPALSQVFP